MITPELRKIMRRIGRIGGHQTGSVAFRRLKAVDHRINERADWERVFKYNAENGVVAVCRSGMDCDCTQYARTEHIPVPISLMAWVAAEDHHREWLDGPESTWIARPSSQPERHASADRALEAYEDGHPSVVYWGDL